MSRIQKLARPSFELTAKLKWYESLMKPEGEVKEEPEIEEGCGHVQPQIWKEDLKLFV
jgi:hypothetical protein